VPDTCSRRRFLKGATATAATLAMSAASYGRIVGANERISLGLIGCGVRGVGTHMAEVHKFDKEEKVEFTAVCDPWRVARENAAALVKEWYGREARQFTSYRDVLALKDVDAVMIASPDHVHTTQLEAAAKAGKDVYVEKPVGRDMEKLKSACDAVKAAGVVCQVGTQLRAVPILAGCRELYKTGILGKVHRVEQARNAGQPWWYHYLKDAQEKDVDWPEFLADLPMRPFSAELLTGWYGYREFCDGPVPQQGVHYIDLVHYITGAKFPTSAVCQGGVFVWKDEHKFTCPDQVEASWIYPEGFMVNYSQNLSNSAGRSFKFFGDQGTLDIPSWSSEAYLTAEGGSRNKGVIRGRNPVNPVEMTNHFQEWLQCIRSRKAGLAPIDAGYQHSVACIMAVKASDTGRRQVYDAAKREIREG